MPFLLYGVVLFQNVGNQDARFTLAVGTTVLVLIMSICLAICVILKVKKRYVVYHPVAALVLSFIMLDVLWMSATNKKISWR
jgi:K+ transporter